MARRRTRKGREYLHGEETVRLIVVHAVVAAARVWRRRLTRPAFIGVTGSGGKTTTKALIDAVLGTVAPGTGTRGTGNKLWQVASAILRTRQRHAFSVIEVAAWRPGSVARVARLVRPDVAVVTVVGLDHRSRFRSIEAVAAEKRSLVAALPPGGTAVLNADDPHAMAMADGFPGRVISFGEAAVATVRAEDVRSAWPDPLAFTVHWDGRALPVQTRLHGRHLTTVVLAALATAVAQDVPLERALEAVAAFEPVTARMSIVEHGGVTFVRDDNKAPVWSLGTVNDFLAEARAIRKVLVLGSLSDYPGSASAAYKRAARAALAVADEVVFVGPNAKYTLRLRLEDGDPPLRTFATVQEAAAHLDATLRPGDLVVLKGSNRADHLVRILLARTTGVGCWRMRCRRQMFCEDCELLHVPAEPDDAPATSRDTRVRPSPPDRASR